MTRLFTWQNWPASCMAYSRLVSAFTEDLPVYVTELTSLLHDLFPGLSVHWLNTCLYTWQNWLASCMTYSRLVRKLTEDLQNWLAFRMACFSTFTDDLCVQVRELTSLQQDVLKEVLTNTQDDVKNIVQSRESSCKWVLLGFGIHI